MISLRKYAGWLGISTLLCYLLSVVGWLPLWLPTLLVWCANVAMWKGLPRGTKNQVGLLILIGTVALVFAALQGVWMSWQQIFAVNLPMLSMFVAVSFLDLTSTVDSDNPLPKGLPAIINTAAGVHLLGAVINLSIVLVVGDRLKGSGKLSHSQQFILTRSFSAAAWWSPFFIATGVALTYAPGMQWHKTLIPGLSMAIIAIAFSCFNAYKQSGDAFQGYPIRRESLFIPFLLACVVIVLHFIYPQTSILVLICIISPLAAMVFMHGKHRGQVLYHFVSYKLPQIGNQFALFLGAGIFSNGIAAVTLCYPQVFNFQNFTFNPLLFSLVLAGMILVGNIGIHPVVSIAIVSPMLIPIDPDPTQLGFLFVSAWAISAGSSPLTGMGLLMTGRYGISSSAIVKNGWYYAVFMWLLCSLTNGLFL